jgi:hypothetical protein
VLRVRPPKRTASSIWNNGSGEWKPIGVIAHLKQSTVHPQPCLLQ